MPEILKLRKLSAGYGPLRVLHEIDLTVQNGERIGLVGLNGHGKTTLLRAITHMSGWQQGSIKFNDVEISIFGTGIHDPKSEKEFNLDKIRKIMEVNYFGTMNSINSVYNYYNDKKSCQISIISSVAGYRGLPAAGAYCASKSALTSFAESLHFEMRRKNVRVSLVSPGFIKTPMTDQNDFPMPMIKSPEFAANEIYKGLTEKKSFEIHFPKAFTYFLKFLQILPSSIYFKLVSKGMKKIDY